MKKKKSVIDHMNRAIKVLEKEEYGIKSLICHWRLIRQSFCKYTYKLYTKPRIYILKRIFTTHRYILHYSLNYVRYLKVSIIDDKFTIERLRDIHNEHPQLILLSSVINVHKSNVYNLTIGVLKCVFLSKIRMGFERTILSIMKRKKE